MVLHKNYFLLLYFSSIIKIIMATGVPIAKYPDKSLIHSNLKISSPLIAIAVINGNNNILYFPGKMRIINKDVTINIQEPRKLKPKLINREYGVNLSNFSIKKNINVESKDHSPIATNTPRNIMIIR